MHLISRFEGLRATYRTLKVICTALTSILEKIQLDIKQTETTVVTSAMHHGLMLLPEEIFMRIIDISCAQTEEQFRRKEMNDVIRRFSLVSWRFRRAVENTPSFWTRIDNQYCLKPGFEIRVARARNAPLVARLDFRWDMRRGDQFSMFSQISLFKDRFQQLDIRLSHTVRFALLPFLVLPNVSNVKLRLPDSHRSHRSIDWIYDRWTFPNVRSLETLISIPSSHARTSLTTVILRSHNSNTDEVRWYERLMNFLRATPNVESLTLDLSLCMAPEDGALTPIVMQHLSVIHVYNLKNCKPGMFGRLRRILASLKTPNIDTCAFTLNLTDAAGLEAASGGMEATIPEVTKLSIAVSITLETSHLKALIKPFCGVKKLELDVSEVPEKLCGLDSNLELDQLRHVVLVRRPVCRSWIQHSEFRFLTSHWDRLNITFQDNISEMGTLVDAEQLLLQVTQCLDCLAV